MSGVITVVVGREPATAEWLAQYVLLHVHDDSGLPWFPSAALRRMSDAAWAAELISEVGLLDALFGHPNDLPRDLLAARKFLVRGRMVLATHGNPLDGGPYEEAEFEVIDWRALPGAVEVDRFRERCRTWEYEDPSEPT